MIIHEVTEKQHKLLFDKVKSIINGTTKVGKATTADSAAYAASAGKASTADSATNASQLGGKSASEYALNHEVFNGSLLEHALTLPTGTYEYSLGNNVSDLPNNTYAFGNVTIRVRSAGAVMVNLWGIETSSLHLPPAWNYYNGASWSGWKTTATTADLANYFNRMTGDTIYGNSYVKSDGNDSRQFGVENEVNYLHMGVTSDGAVYLQDKNSNIITKYTNGATYFEGTASGNLPLSGGTVGDGVTIVPFKVAGTTEKAMTEYIINGVSKGGLGFDVNGNPIAMYTGIDYYEILTARNVGYYALPISGGTVTSGSTNAPITVEHTGSATSVFIGYQHSGNYIGGIGIESADTKPIVNLPNKGLFELHHDGNSQKVTITADASTAPSTMEGLWAY